MTKIVVSQSMYFPWVGLLEQIKLADIFVHYNDVQFTKGFYNRVQYKHSNGTSWLTVPLKNYHRGLNIDEVLIDNDQNWKKQHRDTLKFSYAKAQFCNDMLEVLDSVFDKDLRTIAEVSKHSILALADYFDLSEDTIFMDSKDLNVGGHSSVRLHDIVKKLEGSVYITGHGAKNYLDYSVFESSNISVEFMNYEKNPYKQCYGEFDPYVSSLDLIANCGKMGMDCISSQSMPWRKFLAGGDVL